MIGLCPWYAYCMVMCALCLMSTPGGDCAGRPPGVEERDGMWIGTLTVTVRAGPRYVMR